MNIRMIRPLGRLRLSLLIVGIFALKGMAMTEFNVSPSGRDDYPGTVEQPFATLERSRQAIRDLKNKNQGSLPASGVTVWLAAGLYPRESAFELTAEDSGTPQAPIVYRAAKNAQVHIIGGRSLTAWKRVDDPAVLKRLHPAARGQVYEADLHALGIKDAGRMQSRGFGRPSVAAHAELFFNLQPMTLARWPNEGQWAAISGFPSEGAADNGHGTLIGKLENGFYIDDDRPSRWQQAHDVWVHGYWTYDWANSYERMESWNPADKLIKTAPPYGHYGFLGKQRIYFLNILEELDQAGEYFVDSQAGRVYFWPPANLQDAQIMLSLLEEPLIRLQGASHVVIRGPGLVFECTRGRAIEIIGGQANLVAGCTIRNTGNYGLWIEGGTDHRVLSCDIYNNGDGGVHAQGGDRKTLVPGGHSIENCHFHHTARWSRCYFPAIHFTGVGLRAAHNLIHDHPHCPILFSGNEMVIEFNEIHDVCQETGDVGGIYMGRDYTMRGNIIRHNFLHHIFGPGNLGSIAVYLDDCASGTLIYGNLFWKTQLAAFIGGGRDVTIENNIFVDCQPAVQIDGRGLDPKPVWHNMVSQYMKARLEEFHWQEPPYSTRYPQLATLKPYYAPGRDQGVPPEGNRVIRNICVGGKWLVIHWHAQPEMVEVKDNFTQGDPLFENPASPQETLFTLREQSPAYPLGFTPIPVKKIGLQQDEYRPSLPASRPRD